MSSLALPYNEKTFWKKSTIEETGYVLLNSKKQKQKQ